MLKQQQIFDIIKKERDYQDSFYKPDEKVTPGGLGPTRRERDKDVTSHIVLLDLYVNKAKVDWTVKGDNRPALKQIAKIAAIAVRALECANGSESLLEGLR